MNGDDSGEILSYAIMDVISDATGTNYSRIIIHHINPLTVEDILNRSSKVFDPENVICTCLNTHQAIHFGDETILNLGPIERKKNDTCPWRHD